MQSLEELRARLDVIDRELLQLVAERQTLGRQIAEVKRSAGQPTRASEARALATSRSATPTMCMPSMCWACDRIIEPNLPAPIRPTRTGRPAAARAASMV